MDVDIEKHAGRLASIAGFHGTDPAEYRQYIVPFAPAWEAADYMIMMLVHTLSAPPPSHLTHRPKILA